MAVHQYPTTGYRLLDAFRRLFDGREFHHRSSTQGDALALEFYEDLLDRSLQRLGPTSKLIHRATNAERIVNLKNQNYGRNVRRGDGTMGEPLHDSRRVAESGFLMQRGTTVITEIGVEVKILSTALGKQRKERITGLNDQVKHFNVKHAAHPPLCVAIVGVNRATSYTSYEGDRRTVADGITRNQPGNKVHRPPSADASSVVQEINAQVGPNYTELLVIEFIATNAPPYPFSWANQLNVINDYNALLTRVSSDYEATF